MCSHELEHFDRALDVFRHVLDFDEAVPTLLVLADHPRDELAFRARQIEFFRSAKDVEGGAVDCAWALDVSHEKAVRQHTAPREGDGQSGTFRKVRTGAQRRAQESAFFR